MLREVAGDVLVAAVADATPFLHCRVVHGSIHRIVVLCGRDRHPIMLVRLSGRRSALRCSRRAGAVAGIGSGGIGRLTVRLLLVGRGILILCLLFRAAVRLVQVDRKFHVLPIACHLECHVEERGEVG